MNGTLIHQSNFLAAAYGNPHDTIPIWIMRQAGRYLPQFQAVRKDHSFLEICNSPELMARVTLDPIEEFGFDAAIVFSDILLPVESLGLKLTYPSKGPVIEPPLVDPDQIEKLESFDPREKLSRVLAGITLIRERLDKNVPLLGFVASPFTLLSYMIEGGSSKNQAETKKFIFSHRRVAHRSLAMLSELLGEYLKAQIEAGSDGVQVFDSVGGVLAADAYFEFSLPYIRRVFDACETPGVPRSLFVKNTSPFLHALADINCEILSVDWHVDLKRARNLLTDKTIQGNLDPGLLLGDRDLVMDSTMRILDNMAERPGFIFNLGHGILPGTPVDNVRAVVDAVHSYKVR